MAKGEVGRPQVLLAADGNHIIFLNGAISLSVHTLILALDRFENGVGYEGRSAFASEAVYRGQRR